MKNKKLILDNVALEAEFFEDVILIGIVSPLESYKLAWSLNEYFNFNFEKNHACEIEVDETYFSVCNFFEEEKLIEHYLYSNRNKTKFLLSEMKNVDFIWMIKGIQFQPDYLKLLQDAVKKIPQIVYTFDINPDTLSQRQYLIL